MLKKNKITKLKNQKNKSKLIIKDGLKIEIKIKNLILENKQILFKELEKKYGLFLENQRSISKKINRTVVNKGPVCHSKSKESYNTIQKNDYLNFSNKNLAQSLKFFIEADKFFLKKGSSQFKLSINI